MAHTTIGALLTERHRTQQLALDAAAQRDLDRLWALIDPTDIDGSWAKVGPLIEALVQGRRADSAAISAAYLTRFHAAETTSTAAPTIRLAEPLGADYLAETLAFTGPIQARRLLEAGAKTVAADTLKFTSGNVTRLVLNGGRETITRSVRADRRTLGYARVTDGNPCAFCAMLAARGAVYGEATGDFPAHRACGCSAEPVFSDDPVLPGRADEYQTLWSNSTKGLSGRPARQAFRRAYESARSTA